MVRANAVARALSFGAAAFVSVVVTGCQEVSEALGDVSEVMGAVAGGPAGEMTKMMRPMQSKMNETMAKVAKEYPRRTGMVVATFACYVPGEIDATRLRGDESCRTIANSSATVTGGKKMIAVIPTAVKVDRQGGRHHVGEVKPNALIEIMTIDYAERNTSKQVYFFGDKRFDLKYVGTLAAMTALVAVQQKRNHKDDPIGEIARIAAVTAGVAFVASLSDMVSEMAKAAGAQGTDIVSRSMSALAS
jgi:hypothetical protein